MRTFPIFITLLGIVVIIPLSYFFMHKLLTSSGDYVQGIERVEFTETIELYDGENSVYFDSTKESLFLSAIFGDTTINEVYITSKDGSTEHIPLNKLSFEIGDKWSVRKEGIEKVKKDGSSDSRDTNHYTIIGPEFGVVDMNTKFTTVFRREFPISHDTR